MSGRLVLVTLALREAVPGAALPSQAVWGAVLAAMAVQILIGVASWMASPGLTIDGLLDHGLGCMAHDLGLGLPALAVTLWLVFRALPLRAEVAGLLGGAGAGIIADAVLHLLCPITDLRHVLVWHTGVIVLLALSGALAGRVWNHLRWRC